MTLFGSILFTVFVAWALTRPHLELASDGADFAGERGETETLLDQKSRCMQLLKDLELDFSTGKISEGDYTRMRGSLTAELGALLTRIDESTGRKP